MVIIILYKVGSKFNYKEIKLLALIYVPFRFVLGTLEISSICIKRVYLSSYVRQLDSLPESNQTFQLHSFKKVGQ